MQGSGQHYVTDGELPDEERDPSLVDDEADGKRKALYNRLRSWLDHERDRQAENRYQMALDADFYDGLQWSEEDALAVEERGQAPLVYNEIKVGIDWILGSEKRNRVDWRVLPREQDDVASANVKTKVLKYVSDVNRVPFVRSKAFAEAAISGLSWLEDGISTDATADILHAGNESWRYILHDSYHQRPDGRDMRYLFRWRHLDEDVAKAMFPGHDAEIERAAMGADQLMSHEDEELWYLGAPIRDQNTPTNGRSRYLASTIGFVASERRRVKVYECWYREPTRADVLRGGSVDGEIYDEKSARHASALSSGMTMKMPSVVLRVRVAFFTDGCILDEFDSPFSHNEFPFTPIYAFRRGRDGLPYGFVRNQRDPQEDLNKRMSKSLFLLSVNQLIVSKDAFSDAKGEYSLRDAIENASDPNGVFVLQHPEAKFELRRDFGEVQGQLNVMEIDRHYLQNSGGTTNELVGRQSNAVSGRAILARQEEGVLTTSGLFDNYRLAIQCSGSKQLSNAEKFYALPKVIRLTEEKGQFDWLRINQPEVQPDGSVRFIDDITATRSDFTVDEQDYRQSMRQATFDSLREMVQELAKSNPMFAISMLDMVVDLADFPGKEQMVERLKKLIAEARGEATTPEQAAAQAEAAQLEKQAAAAKIAVDESKADLNDAQADKVRVETQLAPITAATGVVKATMPPGKANAAPAASGAKAVVPPPASQAEAAGAAPSPAPAPAPNDAVLSQVMQTQQATAAALDGIADALKLLAQGGARAQAPRSKVIRMPRPDGTVVSARIDSDPTTGERVVTMLPNDAPVAAAGVGIA